MPKCIVIPADESQPITVHNFMDFQDYQSVVEGTFEAIDLEALPFSFFVNDEGKLIGLAQNRRATLIWWSSVPGIIGRDVLHGDVVLIGAPDDEGDTTSLPDDYVDLLMNVKSYRVEYTRERDMHPRVSAQVMYSWADAYEYAVIIIGRFPDVPTATIAPA